MCVCAYVCVRVCPCVSVCVRVCACVCECLSRRPRLSSQCRVAGTSHCGVAPLLLCGLLQALNSVAALVLEVYGEDTDRAYFAFQRITDVFLSGLLHKGALTKVTIRHMPGPSRCLLF